MLLGSDPLRAKMPIDVSSVDSLSRLYGKALMEQWLLPEMQYPEQSPQVGFEGTHHALI